MSTIAALGLVLAGIFGVVVLGFIGMLVFGYWQHIRAGRKTHKAPEAGE